MNPCTILTHISTPHVTTLFVCALVEISYVDQLNAFPEFTSHWADCLQTSARLFLFILTISLLLALCYMLKYPCFYKNKLQKKKKEWKGCARGKVTSKPDRSSKRRELNLETAQPVVPERLLRILKQPASSRNTGEDAHTGREIAFRTIFFVEF